MASQAPRDACRRTGTAGGLRFGRRGKLAGWWMVALCCTCPSPRSFAAVGTAVASEVHEVSLWLADPTAEVFNSGKHFPSGLPANLAQTRPAVAAGHASAPAAFACLTFYGEPFGELEVDVRAPQGRFVASWPPARKRSQRLSWFEARLRTSLEENQRLSFVPKHHWIRAARQGSGLFLQIESRVERFLTYQAELKLALPIGLEGGPETYHVENKSRHPLHDVVLAVGASTDRRCGWLERLPPLPDPPSAAQPPAVSAAEETTSAATDGSHLAARAPIRLADPSDPQVGPEKLANRLLAAGLAEWEAQLLSNQVRPHIFEGDATMVLLRLAPATLDEWLPLDIDPQPEKIVRVGLLLVRNIDPAAAADIDRLIAELGDPVYAVRQSAHQRLVKLGSAAMSALQQARQHDDAEVVLRATRILRQLGEEVP